MEIICTQSKIKIIPENDIEIAYLTTVFNLPRDGDCTIAKRVNVAGLNHWAFLEIVPRTIVPRTDEDTLLREGQSEG